MHARSLEIYLHRSTFIGLVEAVALKGMVLPRPVGLRDNDMAHPCIR